jgi:hypothetical protein
MTTIQTLVEEHKLYEQHFRFFASKQEYLDFKVNFKVESHKRTIHSSALFLLRNILTGKPFDNGFTPIKNTKKITNGLLPYNSLYQAFHRLLSLLVLTPGSKPFGINEKTRFEVVKALKDPITYRYIENLRNVSN